MLSIQYTRDDVTLTHCIVPHILGKSATQVIKQTRPQELNRGGLLTPHPVLSTQCSRFRGISVFVLLRLVFSSTTVRVINRSCFASCCRMYLRLRCIYTFYRVYRENSRCCRLINEHFLALDAQLMHRFLFSQDKRMSIHISRV